VCVGYLIFLTLLLLTSDPSRLIGFRGDLPWVLRSLMPLAHAVSFTTLAILALVTRWPVPRWIIVLTLVVYGGLTEVFQGFVPHRTPDWADWLQDIAGVVAGVGCCWGTAVLVGMLIGAKQDSKEHLHPASPDECSVVWRLLRRSISGERSWWN
jgi:hypothetical protein